MKPYQGPAGKPEYQRNLYRNNMQGGDHQAFIGYLLGVVQELAVKVSELEGAIAHGGGVVVQPTVELAPEPVALPELPAPVVVIAPQPIAQVRPEPVREVVADSDVLQHIVLDLPDEPTTKKRGK